MPASTDTSVALSQRAKFGIFTPPSPGPPVNAAFHAAEALLNVDIPVAGIFCSFDTTWTSHATEWTDFASISPPRTLLIAWQPDRTSGTVSLAGIAAGQYDTHIDQMVAGMAAYAGQVIVRFGHEMNGNWYKWSVGYTGANKGVTSTADYIAAFRYIQAKLKAADATIQTMFCPNGEDVGGTPMEDYYPGNAYVDLLAFDSYNNYKADHAAGWTTPYETYQPMYDRVELLHPSKDIWIPETGCMDNVSGKSKATWFNQLFAETHFARIKGYVYFNAVGGQDWRFATSPGAATAAATGYQSVLGAVPYSGSPVPSFTIPPGTAFMVQSPADGHPTYRVATDGTVEWSNGSATTDARIKRAGTGILDAGPAIKFANSSSPAQQGNGPVAYGKNGGLYLVPSAGPEYLIRRALLDLHGLKAISCDPALATNVGTLSLGRIYFARVRVDQTETITGVIYHVGTAAVGATSGANFVALYDGSGNRLGVSADQTTNFGSTGEKKAALTATYTAGAGTLLVAILTNASTTGVGIARSGATGGTPFAHNFNVTGVNSRFSSFTTTGQTSMPTSISTGSIDGTTSLPLLLGLY